MRRSSTIWLGIILILVFGAISGCGGTEGTVSFVEPIDGASVTSPFWVTMESSENLWIEPAFAEMSYTEDGSGHFSIIVDDTTPANPDLMIKPTETSYNFSKGQKSAMLSLPKGQHTLTLYFTKTNRLPYSDPYISQTITVNVTEQRAVKITEPVDRAQVVSPFTLKIATEGIELEPASAGVSEGSGHHHILVDKLIKRSPTFNKPLETISIDPLPTGDSQYIHLEDGQSEIELDLPKGQHVLRLLVGKGDNMPYDPPITDMITITVK